MPPRCLAAALVALAAFLVPVRAAAAEPDIPAWFKSLTSPAGVSCCDIADCHLTQERWDGDQRTAFSTRLNRFVPVPEALVLRDQKSILADPVLCEGEPANGQARIYCYVELPTLF